MEFGYTEEQLMFRDSVYRFAKKEIAPLCEEADLNSEFSFEIWKKLGNMGLLGLPFPEELGGSGADVVTCCLDESGKYLNERQAFGKPINRYQEISFKLADMMIMIDISRLLLYRAAWANQTGDRESAVFASCAKLFASESATQIAGMAMQVHGGNGYLRKNPLERFY